MLPRTPAPKTTESLLGYTLRISETNGYDTPWHILSHAGFTQGEMRTAGFPVEKLAAILGRDASALAGIAYCADSPSGRYFKILGHSLGGRMTDGWLRLTKPQFCPRCADEDGHVDAFWDLSQAVACPKHECQLLSACPSCGQPLRWFRPGILECRCGANLAEASLSPVAPALVALMAVLKAKLHKTSVLDLPNGIGFPIADLERMPFKAFIVMLDRIASFAASSQDELQPRLPHQAMEHAARVLADWPSGYHSFLERLGAALKRDRQAVIGLRKQFAPFYESMFKANPFADDFAFLRNEFINFGKTVWGEAVIDQKLLRDDMELGGRFQSQYRTACDIGVRPVTLQRWAEKGLIPAKKVDFGAQRRYIFDKASVPRVREAAGKVFSTRKAAAHVNLPVSVLRGLRDTGHYSSDHHPRHKQGFHERDLAVLRSSILRRAEVIREIPLDTPIVSLEHVLQEARFWSKAGKAGFVAAYLDGAIKAVGRTGDSWSELFFHRADIDAQASASRRMQSGGAVSKQDAASRLRCGLDVVAGLVAQGFLEGRPGPDRVRVTEPSIDRFASDYVGLAMLANEKKTSVRHLSRLCAMRGIDTIGVSRKSGSIAKFIRSTERQRLLGN